MSVMIKLGKVAVLGEEKQTVTGGRYRTLKMLCQEGFSFRLVFSFKLIECNGLITKLGNFCCQMIQFLILSIPDTLQPTCLNTT